MKKNILFILFLIIGIMCSLSVFAQRNISGKIINNATGKGIPDIKISVKGTNVTAKSSSDGTYSLQISDSIQTIEFNSFEGMKINKVDYVDENKINIYLTKSEFDLLDLTLDELLNFEVNIASGIKALTLRESPGIVSVITEEEIQNSGARDLIDVLRLVPGIEFGTDVQGIVGISMRGLWGHEGKVLLMMDGQELPELSFATNQFGNHYPVDQVKKIEIIRGAGSAIYGGFAELGVINIITLKGEDIKGFSVGGVYGQTSNNYARMNALLSVGKKTKNIDFSLKGFLGDGNRSNRVYTDIYGDSYNMKDQAYLKPLFFNMGLRLKDIHIRLIYDDYQISSRDNVGENTTKSYPTSFDNILGEVKYNIKFGEKFILTPRFNISSGTSWKTLEDSLPDESETYYKTDRRVTRIKGNLAASYDITDKVNIVAGGEYYHDFAKDNLSPEEGGWGYWNGKMKIDYYNISGFLQSIIQTNIVNMTIGGRVDKHSQFGIAFAPRVGLTKAFDKVHAKVLFSHAFRSPCIENIDYNAWLNPDSKPNLDPEKTLVFETELGYKINPKMFVTINAFRIQIDNTIVYIIDDNLVEGYKNLGKTGSQGLELECKIRDKWGYIILNYSFYDTKGINKIDDYSVPGNENAFLGTAQH